MSEVQTANFSESGKYSGGDEQDPNDVQIGLNFRMAMRRLAAAVSVITTSSEGEWAGLAATSVSSLSMEPPSLLVCVNKSASIRPLLKAGQPFAVNLLGQDHSHISKAFGGAAKGHERFQTGDWSEGNNGIPTLDDAIAVVECEVDGEVDYASHTIVIGRVTRSHLSPSEEPLIYCNGRYL
ncbi:MAG: hypothetical protein RL339_657 [Pseudomonadota bacterium]|jgi:flavin reductase (DIM6/NTAB) family NADH-FMN oxidoreductase RutF